MNSSSRASQVYRNCRIWDPTRDLYGFVSIFYYGQLCPGWVPFYFHRSRVCLSVYLSGSEKTRDHEIKGCVSCVMIRLTIIIRSSTGQTVERHNFKSFCCFDLLYSLPSNICCIQHDKCWVHQIDPRPKTWISLLSDMHQVGSVTSLEKTGPFTTP